MDTEIKNTVRAADTDAQYDEKAKHLLANKFILAHILIKTVDEFKGMNPKEAVTYIEGEPKIGAVPIDPGMTNVSGEEGGQKIVGLNSENAEINEGLIRFDIVFYVRMKNGLSQIIINVEAQKDEPTKYDILNRATFYVSRLVSSQKERDFVNQNYDDIKRVFSIWICMNLSENSMNYIHFTNDAVIGSYPWRGRLDIQNIVMIGLSNELPEYDEKYELHRLLGALLSKSLSATEKLNIIETEYDIPIENNIREDVSVMCNLSQGIREDATRVATEEAVKRMIISMHEYGDSIEKIAMITKKSMEEVKAIIEGKEPVLV